MHVYRTITLICLAATLLLAACNQPDPTAVAVAVALTQTATVQQNGVAQPATPVPPTRTAVPAVMAPTAAPLPPTAAPLPSAAPVEATATTIVYTLLVAPGEPGRLYALARQADPESLGLLISDDFGAAWAPFPGGLPVPAACLVTVGLDYYTPDALYASTCQGLYRWEAAGWTLRSPELVSKVEVVYGSPDQIWAARPMPIGEGPALIRSPDGGQSWILIEMPPAADPIVGIATLGVNPADGRSGYAILRTVEGRGLLVRGGAVARWERVPAPYDDAPIGLGMTIDGGTGALYVSAGDPPNQIWRSSNANTAEVADVVWEEVATFEIGATVQLLASGYSPQGLAIYANVVVGGLSTLYRSLDDGVTWAPLLLP